MSRRGLPAGSLVDDEVELEERTYTVEVSGKRFDVVVHGEPIAAGAAPPAAKGGPMTLTSNLRPETSTV